MDGWVPIERGLEPWLDQHVVEVVAVRAIAREGANRRGEHLAAYVELDHPAELLRLR